MEKQSSSLLIVKDLSIVFKMPNHPPIIAAQEVNFSIDVGATLGIVGESGSGKTVSALSILGLLPYPMVSHPTGSILFEGKELLNQPEKILRSIRGSDISMIYQEPMTALNPLHTVEKQIGESLQIHKGLTRNQARRHVIDLLKLVGFPDGSDRLGAYPHQLSGGQRQRVMIAMALACEPKLLIADEPTTALDVTIQTGILDLLKDLQKRFKMAMLIISHDLGMVARMTDEIMVMEKGHVVESGPTRMVLTHPKHRYTQHLVASEPQGHPKLIADDAAVILEAKDLEVTFGGKSGFLMPERKIIKAVDHVSLSLKLGETLGIVGESGSGKSTLAYMILRLIKGTGRIVFLGRSIESLSVQEMRPLRRQLQVIFQDPFSSLNPRFSIAQIVAEGLRVHEKLTSQQQDQKVCEILKEVGLDPEVRFRYPHEFSGGQRQRISIARALILNPEVLVLDEPTSALDRSIQAEIIDLLRKLQEKHNISYLFISHDISVVRAMSHRIIVMKDGKIVESGSTQEVLDAPKELYTRRLMDAAHAMALPKSA